MCSHTGRISPRPRESGCCLGRWRAWRLREPHDRDARTILRPLPAGCAQPGAEFLLLLPAAAEAAAQRDLRYLRLHAALRRPQRRAPQDGCPARGRSNLARGTRRCARRPVQRASRVAGVSRCRATVRHPARIFSRDDRGRHVRPGAAAASGHSTSCTATATRWLRWWG